MPTSTRLRLGICLAVALAAGAVAAARVLPLGPWLEIDVVHSFRLETQDVYDVTIVPRGGEVFDEVRVELLRGTARVSKPDVTHGLAPDTRFRVRVNVTGDTPVPAAIRVSQSGRVPRTYDVELEASSR